MDLEAGSASQGWTAPRVSGLGWWLRSYLLMLRWEFSNLRLLLPLLLIVQVALYGGSVVGLGFFYDVVPSQQALYFATGSTLLALITVGLTFVPSIIAQRRAEGSHDYQWALPVPRVAMMLATLTIFVVVSAPGATIALVLAELRYDIELDVSLTLVPAILLILVTTTSVGAAIGHVTAQPAVTSAIGNLLFIAMFLFSPINYPAERLPGWLQAAHEWLPFEHMANAMRGGLTADLGVDVGRSLVILVAWALAAWASMYWVLGRPR
jgi:ABC-2 type transport system permease protein